VKRRSAPLRETRTPDAVMRHFQHRILGDPAAMKRELEKSRNDAAPIVVSLQARPTQLEKRHEVSRRQLGDRLAREVGFQPLQVRPNPPHLRLGNVRLLEFVLLRRDILGDRVGD